MPYFVKTTTVSVSQTTYEEHYTADLTLRIGYLLTQWALHSTDSIF